MTERQAQRDNRHVRPPVRGGVHPSDGVGERVALQMRRDRVRSPPARPADDGAGDVRAEDLHRAGRQVCTLEDVLRGTMRREPKAGR